jgi:hypothetical protein
LVPGFKVPREQKDDHEARELKEKKEKESGREHEGMLLVVARNTTPDLVSFQNAKDGGFVFELTPDSFKTGEFVYKFEANTIKGGTYGVRGTIIPFLAPVAAQEFQLPPDTAANSGGR